MLPRALILMLGLASCLADPLESFDPSRRVPYTPNGVYARDEYQWWLSNTGQPSTLYTKQSTGWVYHSQEAGGAVDLDYFPGPVNTIVGIVDTGCDPAATELAGCVLDARLFEGDVEAAILIEAGDGHGTRIAHLISAQSNGLGMVGVAPGAKLVIAATRYSPLDIANGITWAVHSGARVLVLAWGTSEPFPELRAACEYALQEEVLILAATPNAEQDLDDVEDYPGSWANLLPNILPVGSYSRTGDRVVPSGWSSQYIRAPGRNILSIGKNNQSGYVSGTSYAVGIAGGVAARLVTAWPGQTARAYREAMHARCNLNLPAVLDSPRPWLEMEIQDAFPTSVGLAWDPSPDARVAGYNIRWGETKVWERLHWAGNKTSTRITGLPPTKSYFVATAKARDVVDGKLSELESLPSNEVSFGGERIPLWGVRVHGLKTWLYEVLRTEDFISWAPVGTVAGGGWLAVSPGYYVARVVQQF